MLKSLRRIAYLLSEVLHILLHLLVYEWLKIAHLELLAGRVSHALIRRRDLLFELMVQILLLPQDVHHLPLPRFALLLDLLHHGIDGVILALLHRPDLCLHVLVQPWIRLFHDDLLDSLYRLPG